MPSEYLPNFLPRRIKDGIHQFIKRHLHGFHHALNMIAVHHKSRSIKIHWDHPSPSTPHARGFVTRDLGEEWDHDGFWSDFKKVFVETVHAGFMGSVIDKNPEGTEIFLKASPEAEKPFVFMRIHEETHTVECKHDTTPFTNFYRVHNEPLLVEAWAEWIHVAGYWHQGILHEKQDFLDRLLQRVHPDIKPGSVKVVADYSPLNPWASCISSDPLDSFADFDELWEKLLEHLKAAPHLENVKLQNVEGDGFTVFSKSSGNRSAWSWTKYKYEKYKKQEAPKVVGPSVEPTTGEVMAEHYSAWRELQFRSYISLHTKPLRLQFWAEAVPGRSIRVVEANGIIYFSLLTMFGKLIGMRDAAIKEAAQKKKPEGWWSCCRRSRMPKAAANAKDKTE